MDLDRGLRQKEIEFIISPLDFGKKEAGQDSAGRISERPPKTTRIELKVAFTDEGTMTMSIRDKGFGELFPSSGGGGEDKR
ncbi:MAG: DUF5716 family protein [Enterocloster sp.]